jgi:outer membrane protein assembly factor BamB
MHNVMRIKMKNLDIKQLDGKIRHIDDEGFVRKSRNDLGLLFLASLTFIIYILEKFPGELHIFFLFLLTYLAYLAIKYYSSHDIEKWQHSRHVRFWICTSCFISLFFLPYYTMVLVGILVYYFFKRKERKYLVEHGTKLVTNEPELSKIESGNSGNEYNKWVKRAIVVGGSFFAFFGLSFGLQYYFESGSSLVLIREVLMILVATGLILLGLFPDYLNVKLSFLIDIKSKYPKIVINLIIILFIVEGIAMQPPGGWADFVQNSYAPEVGMETINKSAPELTDGVLETVAPHKTEAMFRSNLQHTGVFETKGVPQFSNLKWKFETGKSPIMGDVLTPHSVSSPAIVDGVVYFGSEDNYLYALDAESGQEKWKFRTEDWVLSSPAIANGLVYFGSEDGYLYAADSKTGQKKWNFKTGDWIDGSPAVANGTVYFGSDDEHLYAVDANTGQEKWKFKTDSGMFSSPAIENSVVYFGSDSGYLFAANTITGQEIWKFKAGNSISSSPAIADGVVYIGSFSDFISGLLFSAGYLYAVDAKTGQMIWKFRTGAAVDSSPAIYNGSIYFRSAGGNLYAVNAKTGEEIWKFRIRDGVQSSPAVADGIVYFGSKNGYLYAVDSKTGKGIWKFKTDGKVDSSPAIADGVIYFGSTGRIFYAMR